MPTYNIQCNCKKCNCKKVVGTIVLGDGIDPSNATNCYLCKACGHTAQGITSRRWLEFDDQILSSKLYSPIPKFNVAAREVYRNVWKYAGNEITITLVDSFGGYTSTILSGQNKRNMNAGIAEFSGLYVGNIGTYALRLSAIDYDDVISNEFEVT